MKNTSQDFGLFIDNLRVSRKISRENFVDGILSTRQYQRYLKGETSITNANLFKLVDNLELEFFSVYNRYLKSSDVEHKMINKVYTQIMSLEYKEAYDLIQKYKNHDFASLYYGKLYTVYAILVNHKLKRISKEMAIKRFENTIDYPECLNNEVLNFIELTALLYIAQILKEEDKTQRILSKLYNILKFNKITDFDEMDHRIAIVYSIFVKLLGAQKDYDKAIYFSKKGIEICEHHRTMISLSHLYYYCALAYLRKNNRQKALFYAKRTFFTLELENKPLRQSTFIKLFETHFGMKFTEFKTW